ncbi:MAG: hypothetical protein ACI4D9_09440 [Lachnospiraceae bacterium]
MKKNEIAVNIDILALARYITAKVVASTTWERLPDDEGILFHFDKSDMILDFDELSLINDFLSKSPLLGDALEAINEMLTED